MKARPVTLRQLNRALARIRGELERHGVFTALVANVDVYLVTFDNAFGSYYWLETGESGEIIISARRKYTSLADVLRHEFGHAMANIYKGLIRSQRFTAVFGASYDNEDRFAYDREFHATAYAATNASEDFAEMFMLYLKYAGERPPFLDRPAIRAKWQFVRAFFARVRRGQARWEA